MKKMITILMDGMSLDMMNLPNLVDLSVLKDAGLEHLYPECIEYKKIWQDFDNISVMDVTEDKLRSVSSADQALMLSTGFTKNYIDINWDKFNFKNEQLFDKLAKKNIKLGAVTNMPVTDSTIGMFLAGDEINTYTPKTDIKNITYTNSKMQENIANKIDKASWDLLIGGGRMFFRPYKEGTNLTQLDFGVRGDKTDIFDKLNKSKDIKIYTEYNYQKDHIDCSNNRNLVLLNAKDFHFEAEKKRANPSELSFSAICMDAVDILNATNNNWYLLIESGKVDPAAHNNNAYYVLTEILEIYCFISNIFKRNDIDDYAIVLTSDHSTGGMSICDSYNLPFDGFKEGITWGNGPGKKRSDSVDCFEKGKVKIVDHFTMEIPGKEEFGAQSVANYKIIATHSRDVVPLLSKNVSLECCRTHIDLYHNILSYYGIEKKVRMNRFVFCQYLNKKNESSIKKYLIDGDGVCLDKKKYMLNYKNTEFVENCAVDNILRDALSLRYYYKNIIICNVSRKQDMLILEKLRKFGEIINV